MYLLSLLLFDDFRLMIDLQFNNVAEFIVDLKHRVFEVVPLSPMQNIPVFGHLLPEKTTLYLFFLLILDTDVHNRVDFIRLFDDFSKDGA